MLDKALLRDPPFQRGCQTNLLTPHPGPLPFEGRGRIASPVHGLSLRNLVSRNSLFLSWTSNALLQSYRNAAVRNSVGKIDGAIDRINHPPKFGPDIAQRPFFSENRDGPKRAAQG